MRKFSSHQVRFFETKPLTVGTFEAHFGNYTPEPGQVQRMLHLCVDAVDATIAQSRLDRMSARRITARRNVYITQVPLIHHAAINTSSNTSYTLIMTHIVTYHDNISSYRCIYYDTYIYIIAAICTSRRYC